MADVQAGKRIGHAFIIRPAIMSEVDSRDALDTGTMDGALPEVLLSASEEDGFDAALLFTASGKLLSGWTRDPVPTDIVTVMAATMVGSVDTLLESLGGQKPSSIFLKVGGKRLLVQPVDRGRNLLLIAEEHVNERAMVHLALTLLGRLPPNASAHRGER